MENAVCYRRKEEKSSKIVEFVIQFTYPDPYFQICYENCMCECGCLEIFLVEKEENLSFDD